MFCKNCGKEISDIAAICPYCGVATGNPLPKTSNTTNVLAIVGFILSFCVVIAGLICSIIGLKKANEFGGNGKNLSVAGICVSSVWMVIVFIAVLSTL